MKTRCFLLSAVLAATSFSFGCADYSETPQPDETPKAAALPQAPAPHAKKTIAELLVGEWKAINRNGQEIPKEWIIAMEFTATGKLHIFVDDKKNPPGVTIGTYKLDGKTIHLERPDAADEPAKKWDVVIETISDDSLILEGPGKERMIFRRLLADEAPKAATLPEAPAPHIKKTTAELIIGTWKVVKLDGQQVPNDWLLAMEFTREGKLNVFANKPSKARIGTYKLTGETIQFHIPADAGNAESKGEIKIISLNEDQLSIITQSKNVRTEEVLRRVKTK